MASSSPLPLLFLVFLASAVIVSTHGGLERLSPLGVAGDVAGELEEIFLILVLHGV